MAKNLKQKILDKRKVVLEPRTKNPITPDELPTPFKKTPLMKYIELRENMPIQKLIFMDSLDRVAYELGVDRSTVSKWRKRVSAVNL
jgi:hypothetical protein